MSKDKRWRRGTTTERGYGAAWQRVRKKYFDEGGPCEMCSTRMAVDLDHILALDDGGDNSPSNLQSLCRPCHRNKTAADAVKRKR